MAGIGNPDFFIKDILSDGVFRPFVPENCIKRSQSYKAVDSKNLEVAGDDENEEDINLFDDENEPFVEPKEEVVKYVKKNVDIQIGSNNSQPLVNSNQKTLDNVVVKLKDIVKELLVNWKIRQTKTKLQEATLNAFGQIHDVNSAATIDKMIVLFQNVIKALPPNQFELVEAADCYLGFVDWNNFWSESFNHDKVKKPDQNALQNVHIYYEEWVKKSKESDNDSHLKFQRLWELVMIRSNSEAICETVGSIMNQHSGKNRFLTPENFSNEIVLRFNLGPMHLLEGLIGEVLALESPKCYLRKQGIVVTDDTNKSTALGTLQKKNEQKSLFPVSFWISSTK